MVNGALSADGWLRDGMLFGVILHFISKEGESLEILLGAVEKNESQTVEVLAEEVEKLLDVWGLLEEIKKPVETRKIDTFTTDTTPTMLKMVWLLGLEWVSCYAHVLNLIVMDGLKDQEAVQADLKKCRKICINLSKSNQRHEEVQAWQRTKNITSQFPKVDMKTRWNSTEMVWTILENKEALLGMYPILESNVVPYNASAIEKKQQKRCLTTQEWVIVEDLT